MSANPILWLCLVSAQSAQAPASRDAKAEAVVFLGSLDAAFNRGDEAAFRGYFHLRHPAASKACVDRSASLIALGKDRPRRESRVKSARPWSKGEVVHAVVRLERKTGDVTTAMEWVEAMALERDGKGLTHCTLAVEVCEMFDADIRGETFACPPCNYSLCVPGPDWLVRAAPLQDGQCHEAVVLYSLASELEVEVSVHVAPQALGPVEALKETIRALVAPRAPASLPKLPLTSVAAWKPAGIEHGLGARTTLYVSGANGHSLPVLRDLPEAMQFFLFATGRVRYVICCLGPTEVIQSHATEIDSIAASFRLDDEGKDPERLVESIATAHHGRASFEGLRYRNHRAGVEMDGPEGFAPEIRVGPAAFVASWTRKATGCQLMLVGLRLAHGDWTDATARIYLDKVVAERAAARGCEGKVELQEPPKPGTMGARSSLTAVYRLEGRDERCFVGVAWRGPLLVMAEGTTRDPDAERTLDLFRRSFATLK